MKSAYPIVMTQGKEFIVVFVPDFNINTQGKDVPDAIEMARDAIGWRMMARLYRNLPLSPVSSPAHLMEVLFLWSMSISRNTAGRMICGPSKRTARFHHG